MTNPLLLAIAAQAAFSFTTTIDPMTDGKTYVASVGGANGPSLSVECGALTSGKIAVRIIVGQQLYRSGPYSRFASYNDLVRFDDRPAQKVSLHYVDDEAHAIGRDAELLISEMQTAKVFKVVLTNYRSDEVLVTLPLGGAAESIARVRAACKA